MVSQFYLTLRWDPTTTPSQIGPGSNCNERVLHITQSFKTGVSPSHGLVPYPGYSFSFVGFSFVRVSITPLQESIRRFLQPQPTGLIIDTILFTNPSTQAGYDTRSIFKRSLTGLNSEFSFS